MSKKEKTNFILLLAIAIGVVIFFIYAIRYQTTPKKEVLFEKEIQNLKTQSQSDEVETIEKDLEETDLSDIDKELQDIEKELNQAY